MRGYYWARPLKEQAVEEALCDLGCREHFFETAEEFARHFSFAGTPEGWTEVGVASEIGENLLAYAKMTGLLRFRKAPKKEE